MTRYILAAIGAMYLVLSAWCAVQPQKTANTVGFNLQPGAGQSEYLTIYGGMQLALGLLFLLPLLKPEYEKSSLLLCLVFHASLVAFRTAGFVMYSGIPRTTWIFAAVEWAILLVAIWRWRA